MKKTSKEIVKLTAKEIFLTLFDLPLGGINLFDARGYYRKTLNAYLEDRAVDRSNYFQKIKYLKRRGLINTFVEGTEKYVELTGKGADSYNQIQFNNLSVARPTKWDGRFRVVIFDIPEDKKENRDMLRRKIEKIGFRQIQKSVFAYPFECRKEISTICNYYSVGRYLKYMIAEIIEGEEEVIEFFLDRNILVLSDLDT